MTSAALPLVMTTAGLARFTAAQVDDDIDLTVARVGLTAAPFIAAPTLTALPGEFRRLDTVSGEAIGDNIVHMIVRDEAPVAYQVRGFGLFLADGTLFAVYSQAEALLEKSPASTTLFALDIAFPTGSVEQIAFGDTNFLNPPATSETKGVVELATLEEAEAGDEQRVTTGAVVRSMIAQALAAIVDAIDSLTARTIQGAGLVKGGGSLTGDIQLTVDSATPEQVRAGTAVDVAITPAGLAALAGGIAQTGEFQLAPGVFAKIGYLAGPFPEGPVAINFATPFPTVCLIAVPIGVNASGSALRDIYLQEQALTAATFTAYVQKAGSDGNNIDAIRWIAVGY